MHCFSDPLKATIGIDTYIPIACDECIAGDLYTGGVRYST